MFSSFLVLASSKMGKKKTLNEKQKYYFLEISLFSMYVVLIKLCIIYYNN